MTIQELNKLYDDICHKVVEVKFMEKEILDMVTLMFEELYTIKFKENVVNYINPKKDFIKKED